jgi:hypothetical protein
VSIFEEDEIDRLNAALSFIKSGDAEISREEVYFVEYPFEDDQELYQHFMGRYMVENDADAVKKINAILGNKMSARPIVIKDKVNIILQEF